MFVKCTIKEYKTELENKFEYVPSNEFNGTCLQLKWFDGISATT